MGKKKAKAVAKVRDLNPPADPHWKPKRCKCLRTVMCHACVNKVLDSMLGVNR